MTSWQEDLEQVEIYLSWVPPDHARNAHAALARLKERMEAMEGAIANADEAMIELAEMGVDPANLRVIQFALHGTSNLALTPEQGGKDA